MCIRDRFLGLAQNVQQLKMKTHAIQGNGCQTEVPQATQESKVYTRHDVTAAAAAAVAAAAVSW